MPERAVHKKLQDISPLSDDLDSFVEIKELSRMLDLPHEAIFNHLQTLAALHFVEVQEERVRLTVTGRLAKVEG